MGRMGNGGDERLVGEGRGDGLSDMNSKLHEELRELKQANNALKSRDAKVSAANTRLERELSKLTRHVNALLENRGDQNRSMVSDIRKENEKMLLVRRLREQIAALEETLSKKDRQIVQLRRQQNATAMMEMAAAKEEFFGEVVLGEGIDVLGPVVLHVAV